MRRLSLLLVALLFAVPFEVGASPISRFLGRGQAIFWTGPLVEEGSDSWTYRLDVERGGVRLRVGLDHPEVDDDFSMVVRTPSGTTHTVDSGGGLYSSETLIASPEAGIHEITVRANNVSDSNFRVRAKLEDRLPALGTADGPVLPNLQILPPHEASFLFPVTNGGVGDPPQGLDTKGSASCHPEEHAEDAAVRCLRFAYGIRNTGRGPMQLHYEGSSIGPDKTMFQRIQRADGTNFDREAGMVRYHKTHGHYHHSAAVGLQLFKVTNVKKGSLEPAGAPRTKGFAHREELLRDWDTFYPVWARFGFGLSSGYADIYEWDRPGNYIDFGFNSDGLYVVRLLADPVEGVTESNELDNAGYTYLKITGSKVKMIEAGRGQDPWDPCKIVVGFGGHPDPKSPPRAKGCAPDTT
jgi:hypothetical protein